VSRRALVFIVLGLVAIFSIAACSEEASAEPIQEVSGTQAVEMLEERTIIDVRTPAEFGQGHVVGAINIDVEGPTFGEQIAELDKDEPYLVYCRSGRRSAIAAEKMVEAGFTDIADAGGLADLANAGAAIE
jgi:rhodanese-related sulfurtransferase